MKRHEMQEQTSATCNYSCTAVAAVCLQLFFQEIVNFLKMKKPQFTDSRVSAVDRGCGCDRRSANDPAEQSRREAAQSAARAIPP